MKTPALLLTATVFLGGCVAGPDYRGAPQAAPASIARGTFANAPADTFATPPQAAWWQTLGDPELDRLVRQALLANFDIAAAEARVTQSRALLRRQRADLLPQAQAQARYARTRPAIAAFGIEGVEPRDIDLVDVSLDASWELDLAGRLSRAVEGAAAELGAAVATQADTAVRVAAETAQAYVALRSAERRLALADDNVRLAARLLDLVRQRNRLGVASDLEVERARVLLAGSQSEREPELAEIAVQSARLAVLTGREPGDKDVVRSNEAAPAIPAPPRTIQIGDPGTLLRRRPDIRAAERRLAAAVAGIGVATADLYPRVSLLGLIGLQADGPGNLGGNALNFAVGPRLSWSFLDFDRVRARIAREEGRRDEQLALYRGTVLGALEDAEAALARFGRVRAETVTRDEAQRAATRAAELAQARYRAGAGSLLEILDAERDRILAARDALDAKARLATAYITLNKALGLSWQEPTDAASSL